MTIDYFSKQTSHVYVLINFVEASQQNYIPAETLQNQEYWRGDGLKSAFDAF
jgi:hypothetical protein